MPPKKKAQNKISLNSFLADSTLGSWADEMDSLPNAPAARADDDSGRDRFSRRGDDFLSSRPDRTSGPPREDLPLPTSPPYTAFVGNLAFDLTEHELQDFFTPLHTKSVKIIKDRDEKPKGFGYVEFADLDGLKEALAKTGTSFSNRAVRVSVAEPPKERERSGFGNDDDPKFDNPWRREKPPQSQPHNDSRDSHDPSHRRFESSHERDRERLPSVAEGANDWRSSRPSRAPPPTDPMSPEGAAGPPQFKRRGSGFAEASAGLADSEDKWSMGSRFKPSTEPTNGPPGAKFFHRGSHADPTSPKEDEADWRGSSRPRANRGNTSPTGSTGQAPPTPTLSRRKLELLPRSTTSSIAPSPVSSPRFSPASTASSKANPFGSAKPIDSLSREKEIEEKIKSHGLSMSRNSSKTGTERTPWRDAAPPHHHQHSDRGGSAWRDNKPRGSSPASSERSDRKDHHGGGGGDKERSPVLLTKKLTTAPTVRPTLSFAKAAKGIEDEAAASEENKQEED